MKSKKTYDADYTKLLEATCLHEAGHVISAFVLGFSVNYVIVRAKRNYIQFEVSGYTEISLNSFGNDEQTVNTPEVLRIRSIQAAAGPIAEGFLFPDIPGQTRNLCEGAKDDYRFIIHSAMQTCGKNEGDEFKKFLASYLAMCQGEAHDILLQRMSVLGAVTDYLINHLDKKISGETLQSSIYSGII